MRNASVLEVDSVLGVIQRRCEDHGVRLVYDSYAETASTNGKEIRIPSLRQPIKADDMDKLYGYVVHECGHHQRPDVFKYMNNGPAYQVATLFNIIEDECMERKTAEKWPGDHKALSRCNYLLTKEAHDQMVPMFKGEVPLPKPWEENDNAPILAMTLQLKARQKWDDASEETFDAILEAMPECIRTVYDELIDEGWHDRYSACHTVKDTWDLAHALAKRLYPGDENHKEIEKTEGKGPASKPKGKKGDKGAMLKPGGEGKGEVEGLVEGEDGAPAGLEEGYNVPWETVTFSEHDNLDKEKADRETGTGGVGITWEGFTGGRVVLCPEKHTVTHDARTHRGYGHASPRDYIPCDKESRALANQIRRYIQSKARASIRKERTEGRIDKGSIVRLKLPPIDGGEYNRRLFYDFTKREIKDTAVSVLVDWSGSMMGSKAHNATKAANKLAWTLHKQIGIPVEILAFTVSESCYHDNIIVKPFNERNVSMEELGQRWANIKSLMGGNADGDAVLFAYKRLLKRKESRRILIVLSDGAPTDAYDGGHADANIRYMTETIDADPRIELWGIGLNSTTVERYYRQHLVLDKTSEINPTLFKIVKQGYEEWRRK